MSSIGKIVLVGDNGVGKTMFARSYQIGLVFLEKYIPTNGVQINSLRIDNHGMRMWDIPGDEHNAGYYKDADAIIIMFDLTSKESYNNAEKRYKNIVEECGEDMFIVLCGNKVDVKKEQRMDTKEMKWHKKCKVPYYSISVKCFRNCKKVMDFILKNIYND